MLVTVDASRSTSRPSATTRDARRRLTVGRAGKRVKRRLELRALPSANCRLRSPSGWWWLVGRTVGWARNQSRRVESSWILTPRHAHGQKTRAMATTTSSQACRRCARFVAAACRRTRCRPSPSAIVVVVVVVVVTKTTVDLTARGGARRRASVECRAASLMNVVACCRSSVATGLSRDLRFSTRAAINRQHSLQTVFPQLPRGSKRERSCSSTLVTRSPTVVTAPHAHQRDQVTERLTAVVLRNLHSLTHTVQLRIIMPPL